MLRYKMAALSFNEEEFNLEKKETLRNLQSVFSLYSAGFQSC